MQEHKFIVQLLDTTISSPKTHEIKAGLDKDYKYLVGIAVSERGLGPKSLLEQVKVKGVEVIPSNFEVTHLKSSTAVPPNKRFFSWFKPVPIAGDELVIKLIDPDFVSDYQVQIQVLLTNDLQGTLDVLFA